MTGFHCFRFLLIFAFVYPSVFLYRQAVAEGAWLQEEHKFSIVIHGGAGSSAANASPAQVRQRKASLTKRRNTKSSRHKRRHNIENFNNSPTPAPPLNPLATATQYVIIEERSPAGVQGAHLNGAEWIYYPPGVSAVWTQINSCNN